MGQTGQTSHAGHAGLGGSSLPALVQEALAGLAEGRADRQGPVPAGGPEGVARALAPLLAPGALLPERPDPGALRTLTRALAATAADPAHPACSAHLHCPPLDVAVAAELAASALNQSLDSWDQAPGGTELEPAVLRELSRLVGFADPEGAGGVFTTGGTESNLMGLLLARDAVLTERYRVRRGEGIPAAAAGRLLVFCSAAAHFSFARAAAQLGLGSRAVRAVPTDAADRMIPAELERALTEAEAEGDVPICVAATAGTTDLGAVDPLPRIAEVARAHRVRLHVDAAYGGGALFSRRLSPLLNGLERADTVALDLHKLGWQPVAAGVFLARMAATLAPLEQRAAYLNPADDEEAGYTSLLGRSLRTTRRPDVFKLAVTLRSLGRAGLGAMVDRCHALACHAARRIAAEPRLELTAAPVLSTVVFRYLPSGADGREYRTPATPPSAAEAEAQARLTDRVNAELRRRLLAGGRAVVGRTERGSGPGAVRLKLTLLNPSTTEDELDALIGLVVRAGETAEHAQADAQESEITSSGTGTSARTTAGTSAGTTAGTSKGALR
ncbi:pyridoxal phosphate-dependent decarboxylase family protein [Phaeacidiphilus oryzae]|uniref:pyridoxal phosphate-dependent decarboxylase family protein n=1 Tax=Phaeacidiphilus oryzae TaxID=348818 RepID=UPI0007C72D1A|nr:pyridoxal-dependent decarboxylase [Phaeacidiphilus oryzae]